MSTNIAVAVFGSAARGDQDNLSDRDVLIVSPALEDAHDTMRSLRARGWSPTLFTWKRLDQAARSGDLFVSHLQRESRITRDPDNTLAHLLDGFSPRTSYAPRFWRAAELLLAIEHVPAEPSCQLWALDVAAVTYRALAVALLANEGIFRFSPHGIRSELLRLGRLKSTEPDPYAALRCFKWHYRSGRTLPRTTTRQMLGLLNAVDRIFALGVHFRSTEADNFVASALESSYSHMGWYTRARRLEGALALLSPTSEHDREAITRISRRLKAPSEYGAMVARSCATWKIQLGGLLREGRIRIRTDCLRRAA